MTIGAFLFLFLVVWSESGGENGCTVFKNGPWTLRCNVQAISEVDSGLAAEEKMRVHRLFLASSRISSLGKSSVPISALRSLAIHSLVEHLDRAALNNLQLLIKLDLSGNRIREIPNDFFEALGRLKELNLAGNRLGNITVDTFWNLGSLEKLDLSGNSIGELELGVLDTCRRLEDLRLTGNRLKSLKLGVFDELPRLKSLELAANDISDLPLGILDRNPKLQTLNLANNRISVLPLGFFTVPAKIERLNLSGNRFISIPLGTFDPLTRLIFLDLASNSISSLPLGVLDELSQLGKLDLSGNQLASLPSGLFDRSAKLRFLNVSHNRLEAFPRELLASNRRLNSIDLSGNLLRRLDLNTTSLPALSTILAQDNVLIGIELHKLDRRIDLIDLRRNRLQVFGDALMEALASIGRLEISGNPWRCSCLMSALKKMHAHNVAFTADNHFAGKRPACIFNDDNTCDGDGNDADYNIYAKELQKYAN